MTVDPDQFRSFEIEHDLFDLRIDGVPIWERTRFSVFRTIRQQNEIGQAQSSIEKSFSDYVRGGMLLLKNLFYRNPYLAKDSDLIFYGHQRRKKQLDGYWWDLYCDPIHESCDYDYVHFEHPHLLKHCQPAKTDQLRYLDLIQFAGTIQRLANLKQPKISSTKKDELTKVQTELQRQFDADIDLVNMVQAKLHQRKTQLWLLRRLLRCIDPDIAVVVVSYGRETFIEACQEQNIPVVELQHGVIYESHFGYSYPGDRTKVTFPDYLLVWGDFWKNRVDFPIPNERVIPVGYPYLEQQTKQYGNKASKKQLLFISQGAIGKQLSKLAMEVNKHPDIDHDIVYKLHPGEYDRWQKEYPWLLDADFEIIDSSEPPLYQLFSDSSGQVGVYSTAVYEGLHFGLETYLYDCLGAETLQPLLDEGAATLVSSADQLASKLGSHSGQFDREYYFAKNATARTCETLKQLRSREC
jgi:hypothetical protein